MSSNRLEIEGLNKSFDGIRALADFSCSLEQGEILGLIGPNGAGKTTLFNVITGFMSADGGEASFRSINLCNLPAHEIANLGISRTFQDLRLIRRLSVLENVLLSFRNQPGEKLGNILFRWKANTKWEAQNRKTAVSLLEQVGLTNKLDETAAELSYGQQKLLSLVCCLAAGAEILLLDEPVAGITSEVTGKILSIICDLPKQGKSVIIIEHNLEAVMQVCNRVIFMDTGSKVSEGTPEEVRNDPRVIDAYLD